MGLGKRYTAEQIIRFFRGAEVSFSRGQIVGQVLQGARLVRKE